MTGSTFKKIRLKTGYIASEIATPLGRTTGFIYQLELKDEVPLRYQEHLRNVVGHEAFDKALRLIELEEQKAQEQKNKRKQLEEEQKEKKRLAQQQRRQDLRAKKQQELDEELARIDQERAGDDHDQDPEADPNDDETGDDGTDEE